MQKLNKTVRASRKQSYNLPLQIVLLFIAGLFLVTQFIPEMYRSDRWL